MADGNYIDLDDIILNYLPTIDSQIPWKDGKVKYNIDRKYFYVHHDEIRHDDENIAKVSRSNTVLFRSTYRNTTDKPMEYSIDQSRRTVTSVSCTIDRGVRFGGSFELELTPPSIPSLKLGLNNEVSFNKNISESREEETAWTFRTQVPVPQHKAVVAELSVLEEHREGKFNLKSFFSGKIRVHWEYKKKHGIAELSDLEDILVGRKRSRRLGFDKDGQGRIYFETKGVCTCHYGLEQDVVIREVELDECSTPGSNVKKIIN